MKINDLKGMFELVADEGKVITTVTPSSLRVTLLYTSKQNLNDFIEVDEHPEIELPEEPNLEEPEEVLEGLTLVEAYYQLMNENRVLKEENEKQNNLINITMMATDEMFSLLEPLIFNISTYDIKGGTNSMVELYVAMVQRGLKTIDQVPVRYRDEVAKIIAELEK